MGYGSGEEVKLPDLPEVPVVGEVEVDGRSGVKGGGEVEVNGRSRVNGRYEVEGASRAGFGTSADKIGMESSSQASVICESRPPACSTGVEGAGSAGAAGGAGGAGGKSQGKASSK